MGQRTSVEWKGYEDQLMKDNKKQSYEIPNSATEGTSPIYRAITAKDGFVGYLRWEEEKRDLDNAWSMFEYSLSKFAGNNFIGFRPFRDDKSRGDYQWVKYKDFGDLVYAFGNGLQSLQLAPKSNVGIFSSNRTEWFVTHMGNLSQAFRTVAIYDTLGAAAVSYIIKHAELEVIVVEKNKLKALFEAIETKEDENNSDLKLKLKSIIQIDYDERYNNKHEAIDEEDRIKAKNLNITLYGFKEILEKGKDKKNVVQPNKDDLAYIMYTSGTTGNPKGVMLPHRCFASNTASAVRLIGPNQNDAHVSYLPLAHIFETMVISVLVFVGARIAFFNGDIRFIAQDWKDIRPTLLIGVPRVFSKTYDKFKQKVSEAPKVKKMLATTAEKVSANAVRTGRRPSVFDTLVWKNVANEMGFNKVRFCLSAAAPLPPHIAEFLKIILKDATVHQGFGLTETCAGGTISIDEDNTIGHVGVPMDNVEVRLVDAQECGYTTKDQPCPRGEIQLRGLVVMDGYYKNKEETAKSISQEGWFSTGDIGRINPNGTVSIIDRRKNMFKTAIGEYVAAEKVEQIYSKATTIQQLWIYGNSYKTFVVAVIVPDAQHFEPILKEKGLWKNDYKVGSEEYRKQFKEIIDNNYDTIKKIILDDMRTCEEPLEKFERVKDILIESEIDELFQGFNVKNDCMTPTFKLKRPQLLRRYRNQLKELYTKNGEAPKDEEQWGS